MKKNNGRLPYIYTFINTDKLWKQIKNSRLHKLAAQVNGCHNIMDVKTFYYNVLRLRNDFNIY